VQRDINNSGSEALDRSANGRDVQSEPQRSRGLQSGGAEILCARSTDPLIAHDFEPESLALIQTGHPCAFESAYTDQHVYSTVIGLEESIALTDIEPSDGSNCHGASSHEATLID
jgi:hypothetical protein